MDYSDLNTDESIRILENIYANQQKVEECVRSHISYIRLVKYNDGKYLVDEKTGAVFSPEYMIIGKIVDNKIVLI